MNKKDLQHRINQQALKIGHLEDEVARLRNQKQALDLRIAKHDEVLATIRKIIGPGMTLTYGGGGGGGIAQYPGQTQT